MRSKKEGLVDVRQIGPYKMDEGHVKIATRVPWEAWGWAKMLSISRIEEAVGKI